MSAILTMKMWHRAVKALDTIEKTQKWAVSVNLEVVVPDSYHVEADPDLSDKMGAIPLLSEKMETLDLAAKSQLIDGAMMKVLHKLSATNPSIVVTDRVVWGAVVDGKIDLPTESLKEMFVCTSNEKILLPINCNERHWCGIMVEMEKNRILHYDLMKYSYILSVRAIAQRLAICLPSASERYYVEPYTTELGVQADSYNCGIYVLLAFEEFIGGNKLEFRDKKMLQYLRYRYLSMLL
ncbi:hypothetical protein PC128_g25975 [Phytophthora cactorum]|nr:hypothetical protein PC128_g25975 [Phytophthora cactorum]